MPGAKVKKVAKGQSQNYKLKCGVMRFSRAEMFKKNAVHKWVNKKPVAKEVVKKAMFVEKPIGGAKNGGTRMVRVKRLPNAYPVHAKQVIRKKKALKPTKLRASITPGTVGIILLGPQKAKRVVFLKQLDSGLLLLSGPMSLNGCPVRRIHQQFFLATKTKIDISAVKLPENLNDAYFKKEVVRKTKKEKEGGVFDEKKADAGVSEERKTLQKAVDAQVVTAISKHPEGALLKQYLKRPFGLVPGQYPHRMEF
jgi:large subunit ribosomal protein L6e